MVSCRCWGKRNCSPSYESRSFLTVNTEMASSRWDRDSQIDQDYPDSRPCATAVRLDMIDLNVDFDDGFASHVTPASPKASRKRSRLRKMSCGCWLMHRDGCVYDCRECGQLLMAYKLPSNDIEIAPQLTPSVRETPVLPKAPGISGSTANLWGTGSHCMRDMC